MTLSDEDRRRIEEEEYRKLARERLERTVRIEADIRTSGDQRVEVRGVGTEMYRDAKGSVRRVAGAVGNAIAWLLVGIAAVMAPVLLVSFVMEPREWLLALALGAFYVMPGAITFGIKMHRRAQRVK